MQTLAIKNMVCPRCNLSVEKILDSLFLEYEEVSLGEVVLTNDITASQRIAFSQALEEFGFELLEDKNAAIISQLKAFVIAHVRNTEKEKLQNLSTLLADHFNQNYNSLGRLFSSVEGQTIERFVLRHKIEFVKELLCYDEMTLSQIAFKLNYSSVAHLSGQFKKETGMSPTAYKNLNDKQRKPLDEI